MPSSATLVSAGGEADPQRQEKRRRFKEARKQHYNMREQLARWVGGGGV